MSESNGDPYGGGNDTPAPPSQYESVGLTRPTPTPSDAPQDSDHCGALLDLDGLGSLISGLIDVDVGAGNSGNSTHAAALIDVDLGGNDVASVGVLGNAEMAGGSGILGDLGSLDASCLLDGLLCDGLLT